MKRAFTATASLGVLAALAIGPAHSTAGSVKATWPASSLAKADCARDKGQMGKRAFQKRYGPRRAMAKCISATMPEARQAIVVASVACQSELEDWGLAEFLIDWESFEECVQVYADWEMDGGLVDEPDADTETGEE